MLADNEVVQTQSDSHPGDDSTETGGINTTVEINNDTVGMWFPRLKAKLSGVIDDIDDIVRQFQKSFITNKSVTDTLQNAYAYLLNGLDVPIGPGLLSFESTNSADNTTKKVVAYIQNDSTGLLDIDNVILNGTTLVTSGSGKSATKAFRLKLANTSTGALEVAEGDILAYIDGNYIGMIPQGYSFATGEIRLWMVATVDDSGTSTNRFTAPSGSAFVYANSALTPVYIRNNPADCNLPPETANGLWGECTLQPGMEPFNGVDVVLAIEGDGT